jgi:KipI family sensor histidine kinase inhibitor
MPARVSPLGDAALLVAFESVIDEAVNARVLALAALVRERRIPGVRDVVPAYASCAVHFDPLRTDRAHLEAEIAGAVAAASPPGMAVPRGSTVRIPVCYGGSFGPDLAAVAAVSGLSEQDVVALHAEPEYRVFMIGFLPGFAYLGPVNERIAVPRRDAPRPLVPQGSVGLAGRQTGVYPLDAPGGWPIIGRTFVRLFNPDWDVPAALSPGDRVRFVPVDAGAAGQPRDGRR